MNLLILIAFLPLLGFILNGLFGKRLSVRYVHIIGCTTVLVSFILSFIILLDLAFGGGAPLEHTLYSWFRAGELDISFGFRVDELSIVMMNVITGVGFLIHLYSTGYMKGDLGVHKFFSYLNLFTFSMLVLVMADNLVLLFLGWEGVGLCSYLLIGFWYKNIDFAKAGKKAFIVNRIGDLGFILGIFLIFAYFGTLDFASLESYIKGNEKVVEGLVSGGVITIITLLLFVGATGKSAQIPLYTWLPDAMAGPTPVSALIHAATMVTAGVYMIGRLHYLFSLSSTTMLIILIIGGATALYAGTIAISQNDIKKVLAYSTVSQLGYMFMAMAVGAFSVGIFHLVTHAFFKALLFLCAGSVILATHHEQDMNKMGKLKSKLPITYYTMLIGALALSGVLPYISGFMSKDLILEKVKSYEMLLFGYELGYIFWIVGVLGALFTAMYSFRLMGLTFWGSKTKMSLEDYEHVGEPSKVMSGVLVVLALLALFGGLIGYPGLFGGDIHIFLSNVFGKQVVEVPHIALVTILGIIFAIGAGIVYGKSLSMPDKFATSYIGRIFYKLSYNKYYIDELYDFIFVRPLIKGSRYLWRRFDVLVIDGLVNGVGLLARRIGNLFGNVQSGNISVYAFTLLLGVVFVLLYILYSLKVG